MEEYFEEKHHLIIAKKSVKFDSKRADWCNYLNMEEMYQESKGSTGLACEHQEARFACKTKFGLIQPDRLIFVDEVGNDTSQTAYWVASTEGFKRFLYFLVNLGNSYESAIFLSLCKVIFCV